MKDLNMIMQYKLQMKIKKRTTKKFVDKRKTMILTNNNFHSEYLGGIKTPLEKKSKRDLKRNKDKSLLKC